MNICTRKLCESGCRLSLQRGNRIQKAPTVMSQGGKSTALKEDSGVFSACLPPTCLGQNSSWGPAVLQVAQYGCNMIQFAILNIRLLNQSGVFDSRHVTTRYINCCCFCVSRLHSSSCHLHVLRFLSRYRSHRLLYRPYSRDGRV